MSTQRIDETGHVYGQLQVIELAEGRKRTYWLCRCSCGAEFVVRGSSLRRGACTACRSCANLKHGHACRTKITPTYRSWMSMRWRCEDPTCPGFKDYGGRGIKICKRWASFANFLSDMGERPGLPYSLGRIDNDKGYSPKNCKWATRREQSRNTRSNVFVTIDSETRILTDWLKHYDMSNATYRQRLKRGYSIEDAITRPVQPKRKTELYLRTRHFKKQISAE